MRSPCVGALAVAVLAPAVLGGAPPPAPSIQLSPDAVRMGTFYRGATVRVEGQAPPGTAVLVVIRGPEEAEFFNRKERVGPVWLSVDRVHVTRVPSLFIRLGGGDLHSLLDEASVEDHQLDGSAIERRMSVRSHCKCRLGEATAPGPASPCPTGVEPDERQAQLVRTSFLALKTQEGTYQVHPDAVRLVSSAEGATRYTAEVDWPRRARPGLYQVEVLACRDRSVVGQASAVLPVVQMGIPARIGALANSHPTVYGAFAVLAAVVTGLTMDALVRRRRPRGVGRGPRARPPSAPRRPEPAEAPAKDERADAALELETSRRG
jgi:Putative transmembrane protein (Alph_Pro_TM)